jgi:hypothetical protein
MTDKSIWYFSGFGVFIGTVISYALYMMSYQFYENPPSLILLIIAGAPVTIGAKFALVRKKAIEDDLMAQLHHHRNSKK